MNVKMNIQKKEGGSTALLSGLRVCFRLADQRLQHADQVPQRAQGHVSGQNGGPQLRGKALQTGLQLRVHLGPGPHLLRTAAPPQEARTKRMK